MGVSRPAYRYFIVSGFYASFTIETVLSVSAVFVEGVGVSGEKAHLQGPVVILSRVPDAVATEPCISTRHNVRVSKCSWLFAVFIVPLASLAELMPALVPSQSGWYEPMMV